MIQNTFYLLGVSGDWHGRKQTCVNKLPPPKFQNKQALLFKLILRFSLLALPLRSGHYYLREIL